MNNKNIEEQIKEIRKEFMKTFGLDEEEMNEPQVFDGIVLWNFIETKLTQQREELISTFRKFMTYGGTHATLEESEKNGETIFMVDWKGFNNYLSQQREKGKE